MSHRLDWHDYDSVNWNPKKVSALERLYAAWDDNLPPEDVLGAYEDLDVNEAIRYATNVMGTRRAVEVCTDHYRDNEAYQLAESGDIDKAYVEHLITKRKAEDRTRQEKLKSAREEHERFVETHGYDPNDC